jgi:hypothetical protein
MSGGAYVAAAIERSVTVYLTVAACQGPESAAAFGWACRELMEALDCRLDAAAALLRAELDRRGL